MEGGREGGVAGIQADNCVLHVCGIRGNDVVIDNCYRVGQM